MANKQFIRFEYIGQEKPVSYQIPLRGMMLPKKAESGKSLGLKKVHYIPGAPSIWKDDYQGDEKERQLWMDQGYLDINRHDVNAIEILKNHPYFNVKFRIVDEELDAEKDLERFELIEKALELVNITEEDELKATALVLLGSGVTGWGEKRTRSAVKKLAMDKPEKVLEEMKASDFHAKYVAALAIMKGTLLVSPTRTGVTWPDGKVIVKVPSGQDPVRRLADFLSENTEEATITLQEIGERIKRSYVKKVDITGEDEIKKVIDQKHVSLGDDNPEGPEIDLEEARSLYKEKLGKKVPNNKKNDLDWILSKIDE